MQSFLWCEIDNWYYVASEELLIVGLLNCGLTVWLFILWGFYVLFNICGGSETRSVVYPRAPTGCPEMATPASARTKIDLHLDVPQIDYLIGFSGVGPFFKSGTQLSWIFFPLHFVALLISNLDMKFRWKSVPPALVSQDFLSLT